MKPYTVIVLRPHDIADPQLDCDFYVAHVKAKSASPAAELGQQEAFNVDSRDVDGFADWGFRATDYTIVTVFEGHHQPKYFY